MRNSLKQDLERLAGLAYHRLEWSEDLVREFHRLRKSAGKHPDFPFLEKVFAWLFVPFTLWPIDLHGLCQTIEERIAAGERLDAQLHLLIGCLPRLPSEKVEQTVAAHEHDVQRGNYAVQVKVRAGAKYRLMEQILMRNQQFRDDWEAIKTQFDVTEYQDHKGIIRRRLVAERAFRNDGWNLDWNEPAARFQAVFDVFCYRWNLYGMAGDQSLFQKLTVNLTPHGTMIFVPSWWSFDPKRDINWREVKKLHGPRVVSKQGEKLLRNREEQAAEARNAARLDTEARAMGLKGERRAEWVMKQLRWAEMDTRKLRRVLSQKHEGISVRLANSLLWRRDQSRTVCGQTRTRCDQSRTAHFLWSRSVAKAEQKMRSREGERYGLGLEKKYQQLQGRVAAPFVRDIMARFRRQVISAVDAVRELNLSRSRFYALYADYLRACAERRQRSWQPGHSGGDHRADWPLEVSDLLRKLLSGRPAASYSLAASEVHRRHGLKLHRATVRRWALTQGLAPDTKYKRPRQPIRRWQVQQIGQLWQYDASPHRWFTDSEINLPLLEIIDDHSRLLPLAKIYPRETLLAHLDFLSATFLAVGLPLALYVDYHSFFFTHQPDAFTQLGAALRFYDVTLRYAPTPQAKGKIERIHDYWQKRLPALFAVEKVSALPAANQLLDQLRLHRNAHENHREIGSTPKAAWDLAHREKRSVLRQTPRCPWWPYVWSQRSAARVDPDGRIAIAGQRLRIDKPPGAKVIRCLHPNGDHSILAALPAKDSLPVLLLHSPAPNPVLL